MRYVGVFNRESGAFRALDMDAFCKSAADIFAAHGHSLDCRIADARKLIMTLERALEGGAFEAILAGGGDGTVSTAANLAYRHGVALAVLPAGTMNLFARALQVPPALDAALPALASGEVRAIDMASANGRAFVHQFAVGIHPRLVRIRESLTYRTRIGKIVASLRAVVAAVLRPPDFEVELRFGGVTERRRVSGITISNNTIGEGHIPHADDLDRGVLGVYLSQPMSSLALARLAFEVLTGRWKANPMISEQEAQELTLRFPKRKRSAQAVIDGELIDLAREVHLQIHPGALRIVAPQPEREKPFLA